MNKNAYRTLFSHASGTFIAVAENTRNRSKSATSGNAPAGGSFPLMRFALLGVLVAAAFGQVTVVHAQMIAYKNGGPAPIIDRAANGVPVVQIVQPNGSGLSHNRYTDFNVDRNGVILNNSPTSVTTTLSGYIQGNAQINTGANVILNETLGVAPSHLNGYIEVAGQRADVIIANPNGLSVNGFGVINGGNVTLTTGVAQFGGDGSLAAYRVTRGQIAVDGDGINALQNDSLSLISRSVAFNAQVQARNMGIVTGANSVTPDMTGIEVIQGEGDQPTVAIDSSTLGGLYAQKIKLVGTEAGVGVRTYGDMASSGDFVLDAAGKVSLNGKTHAGGQMTIRSNEDIDNTGTLYAQRTSINSMGQVVNSGTMASQSDLTVAANSINSSGILAAGIDANGQATQAGNLVLNANGQLTATGQHTAGNNVTMTGAGVNLTGAQTSANGTTTLTATNGDILHAGGHLQAAGGTVLQATGTVVNDHGVIHTSSFNSTSGAFSNISGNVTQSGTSDTNIITSGVTNNTSGVIATNADNINLKSGSFINDAGVVTHAGVGVFTINTGAAGNVDGRIATNGALLFTGTSLNNSRGSLIANRNALLTLSEDFKNNQGTLQAANGLEASASDIDNTGGRITSLDSSGLHLTASGRLINASGTTVDGAQGGIIGGNGDVVLTAANTINSGSITAGNNLSAHIGNQLNNDGGRLAAANTLAVQAASLNNAQGTLDAAKINATVAQINNNNGKINADQLTLHAANLSNQGGHIAQFGKDASIIDVTESLDNSNGGVIQTNSTDLTLTPQQLNNNGGTISLAGNGALTIDVGENAVQNAGGTIGSNGATQVNAGSVNNAGGSVFGAGATTVTATNGDIDNSNNGYLGGDSLALHAFAQFNNLGGKAEAMKNGLTVHANSLHNAAGTIQNIGQSALTIYLQHDLNNTAANGVGGFIGSAGSATIHAGDIVNTGGTVYTKEDLLLSADGALINSSGVIQSDSSITASAGAALHNNAGRIEANGAAATLTLSGASIDNTAGRIADSGTGDTTINSTSDIANDAGTIGGNGNVTLTAATLTNAQGQVIAANDLTLATANYINNAQGSLYAANNLTAHQAGATFNNNGGNVSAGGDIALTLASIDNTNGHIGNTAGDGGNIALSTSGNVTNAAGNIGSDNNTTINANTIIGDGKVIAGQDATINLQGDYTNTAGNTFTANRDLHVSTTGTLSNAGNLEAVRNLSLSAANVTNQYGALINAGYGNTVIKASNAVYNLGRIYGDDVASGAQTMTNDGILNSDGSTYQAGVIASRNDMDVGATTIINREHATIQSLNNMVMGGALDANNKAVGNAASIINASATIDAGHDLTLQTASLINQNNHFTTHLVTDPAQTRRVTQYRAYGSDIWYNADQITWSDSGDGGIVLVLPDGNRFEKFYKQDYTQIVQKTEVSSSDPGKITSGRHMTLSGDVTNDKSTMIAGGTLGGQVGNINNIGAPGEIKTTNQMTARQNYYHWVDGHPHQNHYTYDNNGEAYDVNLPSQQFNLPVWTVLDLTKPNQGDNGAIGTGVDNNTVPAGGNSSIGGNQDGHDLAGDGQTVGAAGGVAGGNTGTSGTPQTVGTPGVPLPNISIGNNQLFPIAQNPNALFLVETDPKFTNYKNFVSSDYMLGRLGVDPMATQKRLGDGFYEQKLINDQITELTGKRFLGTYATNEEQYKALMDSGIASAKSFQLTPGIALTAAQMAALTTDIVWLVSQNVTLPDGSTQSVLVPVVYLARVNANDISPTGAVMSGRNIDLSINGTLQNGGTLQASNNTLIHATDIHNSGAIRSDAQTGTTMLVADNDLINKGGSIAGNRVGILAGRDVSMESITSSASSKNGVNVGISKVASVSADQLSIQSGRDINLTGMAITTTGDAAMIAGRDLNLGAVTTQTTSNVTYGNQNHLNESQTQVNGTQLRAGGNLTLAAGQDINAQASTMHADSAFTAAAGRDVTIVAAEQTMTKDQEIHTATSGFMSSSSSHMQDQQHVTQVVGSSVTGDSIAIVSGRDTTLQGSQVIAQHDVTLNAGRDLNIVTAQETSQNSYALEEKKSGFSANILEGVSYGNSAQDQQQNGTSTQQIGSSISGANVNMVSGRDTTIAASAITADQDVGIYAGRNVNVLAAANTDTSATDSHNSGTSFGIQGGLNGRFTNFSNTSAAQTGSGNATTQSTSLISANGGNLNLQAGLDNHYKGTGQGNVVTQGAELLAKNNITLAGNAVDLQAVHNATASKTHAETHSVTLGSSLTGNIGGAITRIGDQVTEAQHTDNDRLKGALALKSGYDAYKLVSGGQITSTSAESLDPNPQNKSGGGFGVSVSLGTSQSKQDSSNSATQARGTTIQANNIDVTAREGDITMEGAKLQAQNIALDAAKNINLLAAKNTADLTPSNSGSNAGIGATLGSNGEQTGLSFQLGASMSKGHANGSETTYDNTQITATDHLTMKSGGDTNLIGAQLAANQVKAMIGGNLNIVTLQDQNNYDSKQENGGFSVSLCIPPICVGNMVTGSVSYAKQTVEHNYHSAVGQSGIAAGSGGFDINVKGNTDLQGGAITSTADANNNTLQTASLTSRDLINQQHTASDSISAGFSTGGLMSNIASNVLSNLNGGAGMPEDGDETSHTNSVISPAKVTITGTGDATKDTQSQANADTLTERDASTANETLANTLTLQQAQELQAQQKKAQENQRAADLAGAALNGMVGDIAKSFKFAEGSPQKIAMHGIVGLIQAKLGNTSIAGGMIAGMTVEAMSPIISDYLLNNGYDTSTKAGLQAYNDMMGLGATLIGAASGALAGGGKESAGAGGMIGKNADTNNRSLHPDEKTLAKQLAANSDGKYTVEQVEDAMRAANNKALGEGVDAGAIVDVNGDTATVYDDGAKWSVVWKDGKQELVQQIPSNISPDLMTYIAQNSGGNYGWSPTENMAFGMDNSSGIFNPFAKANCVGAQCSVVRVDPPLPTREQMVNFTDKASTGTGLAAIWAPPPADLGFLVMAFAFKSTNYALSQPSPASAWYDAATTLAPLALPPARWLQTGFSLGSSILQPIVTPWLDNAMNPSTSCTPPRKC